MRASSKAVSPAREDENARLDHIEITLAMPSFCSICGHLLATVWATSDNRQGRGGRDGGTDAPRALGTPEI
jgi:hypothetical protein